MSDVMFDAPVRLCRGRNYVALKCSVVHSFQQRARRDCRPGEYGTLHRTPLTHTRRLAEFSCQSASLTSASYPRMAGEDPAVARRACERRLSHTRPMSIGPSVTMVHRLRRVNSLVKTTVGACRSPVVSTSVRVTVPHGRTQVQITCCSLCHRRGNSLPTFSTIESP